MQMDRVTQENAALVEEITAASKSVAEQAQSLNEMMARYNVLEGAAGSSARAVSQQNMRVVGA